MLSTALIRVLLLYRAIIIALAGLVGLSCATCSTASIYLVRTDFDESWLGFGLVEACESAWLRLHPANHVDSLRASKVQGVLLWGRTLLVVGATARGCDVRLPQEAEACLFCLPRRRLEELLVLLVGINAGRHYYILRLV